MLKTKARAKIEDVLGKNNLTLDVNFDDEHRDCVKITINGKESVIKYTDLFSFMFMLANKEQQTKMIPVTQELGYEYMKTIQLRVKRNMKKGEVITVHTKIHVPTIVEENIKYELEQKAKLSTGAVETPYMTTGDNQL